MSCLQAFGIKRRMQWAIHAVLKVNLRNMHTWFAIQQKERRWCTSSGEACLGRNGQAAQGKAPSQDSCHKLIVGAVRSIAVNGDRT
jgi:hypothetical protein